MTDQIASITLRADVSDLKTASNELDKLGQAVAGAVDKADDLNSVFRAGAESAKQGSEGLKEQQNALKGLLENIDPVTKALNRLDEQQESLRKFQAKGFLDTDTFQAYNKILDDTRLKLTDTGEAAARAQAELAATQAAEKQSAALKNLLGSIDPTIRAFNSLDEQHAQLVAHFEAGRINGAQFEHFNSILSQTRERLSGVADALPEALSRQEAAARRAGISVGQYSAAMRTLPAQFTDIATQLAGGQSPFLILLQQGGQIKDQFGGVKGALTGVGDYLRTLIGFINPVTVGIGGLVVGLGAIAVAWYKGIQEAGEFNKQLILTGNYSAKSASQLTDLAQKIGGSSGKVAAAARTLAEVVGAGTFKTDQLETVTRAALAMQEATGQSVDATIKNFQKLYASPTKAAEDLNSTLHFLTSSQYDYISSLERRGEKEDAAEAAAKAYSQAEQKRSQQILDNMGLIERAAGSVSKALKGMWDELLNIGRPDAPNDMLRKMQAELAEREKALLPEMQRQGYGYSYDTSSNDQEYDARRKAQLSAISALKAQIGPLQQAAQLQEDINVSVQKGIEVDNKRTDALIYRNRILEQSATWQEKRSKALSELWKNVALAPDKWSDQQRQQAVDAINKQFHPNKTPKTPAVKVSAGDRSTETYSAETLALQAQLKTLQEHRDINDVISQQRKQQWELISKISILEATANDPKGRALTIDEKSLLANKDKLLAQADINAALGDQIARQQKLNALADQATKFAQQQAAKQAEIDAAAEGTSTREAERAATRQRLSETYAFNPDAQKKVLAQQEETYRKEDELRSNWQAGAKRGWADYADSATNTFEAMRNVAGSTFSGLSDMLTSLVTTGTASLKEFTKSMLKMIAEVTNRLLVAYAVQAAMGWISGGIGGGSTPGGSYANAAAGVTFNAKGGVYDSPDLGKYVNGVYDTPQYFTFQGASKFAKGGVFAEAGAEAIMPLTRDSAGRLGVRADGAGGSGHQINVDIYVDNKGNATANTSGGGDAAARALAERMKQYVQEGIIRAIRDDGAIGGNFVKK
ncbi:phage tail tape measure protein [Salmonella enterica]|uniref:Phage tail tape measure protein n=4 Tax=Enterobacteriaceae TaxID=543 RepID=A0A702PLU8_SALHO|nr:phage tail tape measure protein [Salmonella enterica]ECE0646025.1 phage tail tape measure protein [Salmonella enterica subsp. houtenae]EEH1861279.1 phage tail tape measure protein [Salmonella enterica subsp. houtenae serovar 50:g,z51:-]EHA4095116.1 phage tail tape measure protein [Salmonella enterica subsp. enterica]ESE88584.1 tail length tape measure protein [Salmonella enterica subsp. houtenae serovar 50:g,z51:- str. 01-0133]HAC6520988.1 phage tail tape measure protein [Salmonella enteric